MIPFPYDQDISNAVSYNLSNNVLKEMDYMMRDQEEKEEERFRRLDEAIRGMQKARQEVAVAESELEKKKKKKGVFGKRK